MWGAHTLAGGVSNEARLQEIRRWHFDLEKDSRSFGAGIIMKYRGLLSKGASLENGLDEEVERLLLRRILPGRCSICPDIAPGRPTRRRKTKTQNLS